ncbi:hypothetical protein CEB3_c04190 [Peptococcaceae bacterium CEB3]|nr:hypothetical protein CEB3_c04190 [Peptococcaceae bacterium CEB3]
MPNCRCRDCQGHCICHQCGLQCTYSKYDLCRYEVAQRQKVHPLSRVEDF